MCDFLPSSNLLRRNLYKAIPRDLAIVKTVNRDSVSGVAWLFAGGVGDGTDRSVKMIAIRAERKANKIALVSFFGQAIFREIGELVGAQIEYRDGLVCLVLLRAVTVVENRSVAAVGAHSHRCGETVQ